MNAKTKVLIIDDDKVFCQLLNKGLVRLGYQSETAHCAEQALGVENHPDIILLDMRLGEESGLGLIPALQHKFPEAKIVVVTGYANLATAVTAVKKGASNYIAKPVDVKDIHAIIQECLFDGEDENINVTPIPEQSPSLRRLEWEHIHRVLEENDGNISHTAQKLGMHRRTLQRKLKKHAP
jgi:two-component system response regulator RegA